MLSSAYIILYWHIHTFAHLFFHMHRHYWWVRFFRNGAVLFINLPVVPSKPSFCLSHIISFKYRLQSCGTEHKSFGSHTHSPGHTLCRLLILTWGYQWKVGLAAWCLWFSVECSSPSLRTQHGPEQQQYQPDDTKHKHINKQFNPNTIEHFLTINKFSSLDFLEILNNNTILSD